MKKFILSAIAVICVGCAAPHCQVDLPDMERQRYAWFDTDKLKSAAFFSSQGIEGYKIAKAKIFFTKVDLSVLNSTDNCPEAKVKIPNLFETIPFGSQTSGQIVRVSSPEEADLVAYAKLYRFEARASWMKWIFLSPVQTHDIAGWWIKLVEPKSRKTVFAYYSNAWPLEKAEDLNAEYKNLNGFIHKSIIGGK